MIDIIYCEQGTEEWLLARLGIPTSSNFATVQANGQGKTRKTYMYKLLGERLTGEPAYQYANAHMERGQEMEQEAVDLYAFTQDVELQAVGFIRNGEIGCSPDRLIGDSGMLEVKTKLPHLQLAALFDNKIPPEHIAQVQGQLWVAEREWVDFMSYWPGLKPFIKRAYRDEKYIKTLSEEVDKFLSELYELESKYAEAA